MRRDPSTCVCCGAPRPWYRVGHYGFCARHREVAATVLRRFYGREDDVTATHIRQAWRG